MASARPHLPAVLGLALAPACFSPEPARNFGEGSVGSESSATSPTTTAGPTTQTTVADSSETGDPTGASCGNGAIDDDEACDGDDLDGESCASLGLGQGELTCAADCSFDESACIPEDCGNGELDDGEICDGDQLGAATCADEGFDSGTIACAPGCGALDTSGCGTCGNGMQDGDETCDGDELDGQDCASLDFDSGALACSATCQLDTSACGTCGNAIADGDEECDGAIDPGTDCSTLGMGAGAVSCSAACAIDVGACVTTPEVVSFPTAIDSRFTAAGTLPWNGGDWFEGVRDTGIPSTNAVDVHLVVVSNGLSDCGFQTSEVSINDVSLGTFTIMQGTTVIDASFPSAVSIPGPQYTIRYETTMTVAGGCGAAGFDETSSTVTFHPG